MVTRLVSARLVFARAALICDSWNMPNENPDRRGSEALKPAFLACLEAALALLREQYRDQPLPVRAVVRPEREDDTTVSFPTVAEYDVTLAVARLLKHIKGLPELERIRLEVLESPYADSILVDAGGKRLPSADTQLHWLANFYVMPLLQAYARPDGLLDFDGARAEAVYADLDIFLHATEVAYLFVAPLQNFKGPAEEMMFDDRAKVRPLSRDEFQHFWQLGEFGGMIDRTESLRFRSCVETISRVEKLAQPDSGQANECVGKVLTALRMVKPGLVGIPAVIQRPVGPFFGPPSGHFTSSFAGVPFGRTYSVEADELDEAVRVYRALQSTRLEGGLEVAVRRFNLAYQRGRPDDRLLDFWIALEALFLPEEPAQELSYRASLRVAFFLERDPVLREQAFRTARESYRARSAIVHGRVRKGVPEIAEATEDLLRRALRLAVQTAGTLDVGALDSQILRGS